MPLTTQEVQNNIDQKAVLCCRSLAGTVITEDLLEDPAMFDQLVDLGLIEIPEDTLKIGNVMGATLKDLTEGLTALTPDLVEGSVDYEASLAAEEVSAVSGFEAVPEIEYDFSSAIGNGGFVITIEEGHDIKLEFEF